MRYYIVLAAVLLAAGCTKPVEREPAGNGTADTEVSDTGASGGVMQFSVDHPSTKVTETAFEAGDKIGVYLTEYEDGKPLALQLGGNYKNNNPVIFDGERWTSDPVIFWRDSLARYDVYAYYPFLRPDSVNELVFKVATDQGLPKSGSALGGYEASDFLYATKKGVTPQDGTVGLRFSHKMSKFTVMLEKGEDYRGEFPSTGMYVYIHNTVTTALIDLSSGDVVKHPRALTESISAKREGIDRFSAIVVPQNLNYIEPLVEIVCNNVSYMVESRFFFKSGVHHSITVTLNNDPDKIKIEIGGEIVGWN